MKDFWKRKRNKRIAASALAVVMAGFLVWGLFPWQAAAAETTVADDVTINKWHDPEALDDSTKNVGRIWTDKSVSTGNVTLSNKVGESAKIEKKDGSDFLVGLSALSSTAKIMGQTTVPLDIVLVLDVSGSMDDTDKDGVKKIDKLKGAVNSFIGKSAEENNNKPANKQNRISLVKFSGDKTDKVGDEKYRSGRFTYNYTQIVSNYKAYTSGTKSELQNKVNALQPAGATAADYAMEHAKKQVEQSKTDEAKSSDRKNVKRIVIFFTDGQPNHNSGFDETVAKTAIETAKGIKYDADIYTIGVFKGADASVTGHTGVGGWTDKERCNAYMHGMSSNYPNAIAYYNLGTRAPDSDFYKAAENASTLNSIFGAIAEEIASAQSPTHVNQGENPNESGYITFTDQLGDYMQVDDMNALVYANTIYKEKKQESSDQSTTTYTYKGEIKDPNHVYPEGNLNHIKITVKKSNNLQTGDLVTVKIPANMIPLRYYEVTKEGKMTISETYPMRLFYDVSLKADAEKKIETPDEAMQAYINANKNGEGQVQFYSNKYEAGSEEDSKPETIGAYSHFVPATTNDFYYFQNDTFLYKNEACTTPVTDTIDTSGKTTYYYQRDYYKLENGETKKEKNTVTIPGNSNIILGDYVKKKDGKYYIRAGAPRTTSLTYFTENKGENQTGTARTFIKPTWNYKELEKGVTVYLGNNGRISKDVPGALEELNLADVCGVRVTKVLHGHDMAEGQFEFSVTADNDASASKLNNMTLYSPGANSGVVAKVLETLPITLTQSDIGITYSYTFAEKQGNAAGYTYDDNTYRLDITTHDAGDGTLTADVVLTNTKTKKELFRKTVSKKAAAPGDSGVVIPFENRYDGSTDVEGGTAAAISADKTMNGRKLHAGEFQFKLVTKPADGSKGTLLQSKRNIKDGTIGFDALSYRTSDKAAGRGTILSKAVEDGYAVKSTNDKGQTVYTLSYRIYEDEEEWTLPNNVTVVNGNFDFTVTVTDDGQGHLTAVTNYPDGSNGKFGFVNQYGAEPVPVELKGSKTLDHESGLNSDSIADKFTFSLSSSTEEAPLPDSKTAKNDADGNITFGQITFKLSDLDGVEPADDGSRSKDFIYTVKETSGSAPGVTNDTGDKTFTLTLKDDGKGHLSVTKNPADGPLFTFTNTYTVSKLPSSITDQVKVTKKLTGRDLKAGEFHFELLENGEVAARGTNDANGSVTFDKITYIQPGTHTYTVREVNNGLGGVTYDDQAYTVRTMITDNRDGTMNAEHKAYALIDGKELAPVDEITFTNKYEAKGTTASIGAVKRLTGKDLKDGQFTFQLKDETGKVIDEAKNDKAGAISFKALEFDKAGTYKYTISEVNDKQKEIKYDTSEKTVTITVKDSGDGYLQAQVESEKQLIFTNTFEAAGGSGTKTGDNMNLVLPIMMMLTTAAIGSVLLIRRKYHR